jgi:Tfp pilus assembly protein FimT
VVPAGVRGLDARGGGLVELCVALSLLAVVAALGTPALLAYWRDAALRAAAEELAGVVGHGRLLAVSLNASVCVSVGGGVVRFEQAGGSPCSGVPLVAPGAQAVRLAGGSRVSGPAVVFTHLGAATPAGSYVVSDPATGRARRVVVAVSGRVSVQ